MKKIASVLVIALVLFYFQSGSTEDIATRLHNLSQRLNQTRDSSVKTVYDSRGRRDPFVSLLGIKQFLSRTKELGDEGREALPNLPSLTEIKNLFPFTLIGIVYSEKGESLAIISTANGDSILKKGDRILGAQVLDIRVDSVKLLWKKKEIYLTLK